MMLDISRRFSKICESQTVALNSTLAKLKREGKDVVALGAGEPDFDTPEFVKQAAVQAIEQGFTKYTPAEGILELREVICKWLVDDYNAVYKPRQIIITCGAKHAVYQGVLCVCDPGDEVILPAPYWVSYPEMIKLAGAEMIEIHPNPDNQLKITPEQLAQAITKKTKLLILNSPSNPSGAVYSRAELDGLVKVIKKAGIFVLSDEIYDKIVFDDAQFASLAGYPEIKEQLLLVNGVSKSFAMTGWRIGFIAAPENVADAIKAYQGHSTSNPASISQKAALAALLGDKSFISVMHAAFTERRNYVQQRLTSIPQITCCLPQGAFYAFPNISKYLGKKKGTRAMKNSMELCAYLLEDFGVAIVPGSAFGMEGHVRLSFATSMEVLKKALDRIENGLKSLE
jgi:aspartate aminotransferase